MVATAVVGSAVVGGYMAGEAQKDAAQTAADAQTAAADASVAESRRQFEVMQQTLDPYVQAGNTALSQQMALAGLSGSDAQSQSISAIQASPQYEALISSGEQSILQNSAATGGLRGGNTQSALAQYSPAILSQLIESQYSKLGNLTSMGQASAAGVGNAAINTGTQVSNALTNAGTAQAQSALASGQATANAWGNAAGAVGTGVGYYQQQQYLNSLGSGGTI